jgi:membrane fusion protein (multidrug efflux system)
MSGSRNPVQLISVVVAVVAVGWAIYATRHANAPGAGFGGPGTDPPAGRAGAPGGGARPGAPGAARPGAAPGAPGTGGRPSAAGPGGPGGFGGGPVPIVSAPAQTEEVARELRALGTVRANEAVEVTSKSSNIVTAVRFRDGQAVQRGQVLVELDSAQARADLSVATAALSESTSQLKRSRELLATQALSQSQFEQLEATQQANEARLAAARARLEDTFIRAPFAGRVGLRRVSVGSLVNPGAVITTLDDTSVVKVDFAVPENDLASLREGLAIEAGSAAYPERRFAGRVLSIDSRIDAITRAVTVRAAVPNADGALRPGMFVNVTLTRDRREAIVIPEEALVPEQDRQFVFVVADGVASKREVRIGARRPGRVEVASGLEVGERIVVEGTVKVRDGGPVRDLAAAAPAAAGRPG